MSNWGRIFWNTRGRSETTEKRPHWPNKNNSRYPTQYIFLPMSGTVNFFVNANIHFSSVPISPLIQMLLSSISPGQNASP